MGESELRGVLRNDSVCLSSSVLRYAINIALFWWVCGNQGQSMTQSNRLIGIEHFPLYKKSVGGFTRHPVKGFLLWHVIGKFNE